MSTQGSQKTSTGTVPASVQVARDGDSDPVSTQIQQMNIIHEALSLSGYSVVTEDKTVAPTTTLPVASEVDVAAYQEAPQEIIQVDSVEMEVTGHPVQEGRKKQETSSLIKSYSTNENKPPKRTRIEQGAARRAVSPRNINVTGCDDPGDSEELPTFHISLKSEKGRRTKARDATRVVSGAHNVLQTGALGGYSVLQANAPFSNTVLLGSFVPITSVITNQVPGGQASYGGAQVVLQANATPVKIGAPNVLPYVIPQEAVGVQQVQAKGTPLRVGSQNVLPSVIPQEAVGERQMQVKATLGRAGSQNVLPSSIPQGAVGEQQAPVLAGPRTSTEVKKTTDFPATAQVVVDQSVDDVQNVTQTGASRERSGAAWNKVQEYTIPVSGGVRNVTQMKSTSVGGTVVNVIRTNAVPVTPKTSTSPASVVQPGTQANATRGSGGIDNVPRLTATLPESGVKNVERRKCSACENVGVAVLDKRSFKGTSKCGLYQCHTCGQMRMTLLSAKTNESQGTQSHGMEDLHECDICWMDFKDVVSLNAHKNVRHQAPSSFQCSYCSGIFSFKYECDMHEQFTHDNITELMCVICSKEFPTQKRLKKHVVKCLQEACPGYPVKTPVKPQENITGDNQWYNIPHSKAEGPRKCVKCGKKYKNLRNYARHVQNVCGVSTYKCDGCSEEFSTKGKLLEHERQNKDNMHYTCVCGRQFQNKIRYRSHRRLHQEQKPYKCKFCGKGFVALGKCLIHQRSHTGEKPYKCKVCGKEYAMMESLKVHERKHRQDFRFFCKYCQMGFVKKYTYQMHELNHEGHRPFSCQFCGKSFSRKSDCSRHELCTHSQGKEAYRFLCSHCGKAFKLKGDMKVHERIHTGEKPYYCMQCLRGFGRASYYNRHMRNFHSNHDENSAASSEIDNQKKQSAMEATVAVSDGEGLSLPHV